MSLYSDRIKEHLTRYKRERLGIDGDGVWLNNGEAYPYILPQHVSRLYVITAGAGDRIELVSRSEDALTVADVVRLFTVESKNQDLLREAITSSVLPPNWKDYFREKPR